MLGFNVQDGCLEAIVHGFKDGFLTSEDYNNLTQCDSLNDMKTQLQLTDYGNFLQQNQQNQQQITATTGKLTSSVIANFAQEHLVRQLRDLREWSTAPLSQFLDFICYEHMISNVLKLIIAKRNGRESFEMLTKCHPLGWFPQLSSLTAAVDIREMFDVILIDSPIGRFFNTEGGGGGGGGITGGGGGGGSFERDIDELSVEYIRGILLKNYYEQFYDFCLELGGETAVVMCPLLEFEVDRVVLTFAINTIGLHDLHIVDKRKLFPNFGSLIDIHGDISEIDNIDQLKDKLKRFTDMYELFDDTKFNYNNNNNSSVSSFSYNTTNKNNNCGGGGGINFTNGKPSLERRFVEKSVILYKEAMRRQFQYGVFYAWVKLKELEISNLQWIADCIVQRMTDHIHDYVRIM